jgi:hypothetical protein
MLAQCWPTRHAHRSFSSCWEVSSCRRASSRGGLESVHGRRAITCDVFSTPGLSRPWSTDDVASTHCRAQKSRTLWKRWERSPRRSPLRHYEWRAASRQSATREPVTTIWPGRLGVELTERLVSLRLLRELDAGYEASRRGDDWFLHLDVDVTRLRLLRRRFAPKCLDLTERRPHLAGALGAALTTAVKQHRYVTNRPGSRALQVTDNGRGFFAELGIAA